MLEKFTSPRFRHWVAQFRDVRMVGLLVFAVIVLLVSWSSVSVIQSNYELQRQIAQMEEQNQLQELENANLKLKNQYYNTDQYLELQARRQFGKAAPGETVLLVPKEVALRHAVESTTAKTQDTQKAQGKKPVYQQNFEAWMDFFLHRTGSDN